MSDSETAPVDFVLTGLFALFALAGMSLLPEGCVAQAAARINNDMRARIFFISAPSLTDLCSASMPKKQVASRKTKNLAALDSAITHCGVGFLCGVPSFAGVGLATGDALAAGDDLGDGNGLGDGDDLGDADGFGVADGA